jgi:hypothetical protein
VTQPYEEWRVVVKVEGRTKELGRFAAQVMEHTPEDIDVHARGKDEILVYSYTQAGVQRAEKVLLGALARDGLTATSTLSRWNPGSEAWQDPSLPVEHPTPSIEWGWVEIGELGWEVRAKLQRAKDFGRLKEDLRDKGYPVVTDGWKRITVGVADRQEAVELSFKLRTAARLHDIQVRPMSRFRRWLIRQAELGNYASGGG